MPGIGEVMEGAMQQAPQPGRQFVQGSVSGRRLVADSIQWSIARGAGVLSLSLSFLIL
jgi:hypothetical protein